MDFLKYGVEFIGTFLFLSVIIATGSPVMIALTLLAVILLGGSSGGYFNPAVSVMMWANGTLSLQDMAMYAAAQIAGGLAALGAYKSFFINLPKNTLF